ncbi:hypothetical protein C1H87_20465 [Flavivirga eckloniae]|uniref:Peptidase M12B domain-containing protein n=2 Tax=Flavivirga eckloniae TaxID=1803846 RepID=A0A2K9PV70_9FLAO|nr:hypothetical protein C1H87_20465 [Flavivirga eckloniae]
MAAMFCVNAQNYKPKQQVAQAKSTGKVFKKVNLLKAVTGKSDVVIPEELNDYTILSLDAPSMKSLTKSSSSTPEAMSFLIPGKKAPLQLELVKVDVVSDDFEALEMPSGKSISSKKKMAHYRGIIKGQPNSIAAISFVNNEVSGLICVEGDDSNLVLGKLDNSSKHILYRDDDISHLNEFVCKTTDANYIDRPTQKTSKGEPSANKQKCPEIFFDVANDVVRDKGGAQAASNFVEAMFNQVAILYANDGMKIKLSGIRTWTSTTPFNNLDSYRAYRNRNGFNGDLGHFVTYNYSGGVAWVDALCSSHKYGLSGIHRSYQNVPRYSWNISTIAHELGHNFGSPHTHSCSWNGNNTAIDGCYSTEGGCRRPSIPSGGGTIMSYCHLTSAGTNLNKGFGSQPASLIRNNINRASCVGTCSGGGNGGGDEVSCADVDPWNENASYSAGDKVVYRGRLFERNTNNTDWNDLGACKDGDSTDICAGVDPWRENTSYSAGDKVIYNGRLFQRNSDNSDWINLGDCGTTSNNPCDGYDAWVNNVSYDTGDIVIYKGSLFERVNGDWKKLATCTSSSLALLPGENVEEVSNFRAYPIPAKDVLYIEAYNLTGEPSAILLKDVKGRTLQSVEVKGASEKGGSIKQSINVGKLSSGIYFIKIKGSNEPMVKKIIIE